MPRQLTKDLDLAARQADFFFCFAQRGVNSGGIACVLLAARKSNLPRMMFQGSRTHGQENSFCLGANRDQNAGGSQSAPSRHTDALVKIKVRRGPARLGQRLL